MPDLVRSVDDMVADMEKAVEEPEGNTSSGKHRQHVAQAIEKLISSQIIDGKLRYIEDGTGSKAASKTAPALLNVAAAVQEMVSSCLFSSSCAAFAAASSLLLSSASNSSSSSDS